MLCDPDRSCRAKRALEFFRRFYQKPVKVGGQDLRVFSITRTSTRSASRHRTIGNAAGDDLGLPGGQDG